MKTLTRKEPGARKAQAVRFTRDVLDDPEGLLKLKMNLWRATVRGAASKSESRKE
jgi:hypothetical protein